MPLFPTSLTAITLAKWIDYTNSLIPFDEQLKAYNELPNSQRKSIYLTRNLVSRAFHTYKYFGGEEDICVDDVLKEYDGFMELVNTPVDGEFSPEHVDTITFGQFVDAKMMCASGSNKWAILQYLCVIFGQSGEKYKAENLKENSEQFISFGNESISYAIKLSDWFDKLNTHINDNYTLFQDIGEQEGSNMKEHMQRWGWVNFLKSIAKTKVFDISGSGLNSIDSAREASLDDVLTWASEEKDCNIAMSRDMEESYKN